jgi:elongation factor Ts
MEASTVNFTPKDVMKLREKTGLGMMDCKEALTVNNGDMKAAEEWLRAKMKGKMDTRTERATGQGRVAVAIDGLDAAIIEVQCETDFTARNSDFVKMTDDVAKLALKAAPGKVEASDAIKKRVDDVRITTGENMTYARGMHLKGAAGTTFGSYVHHDNKRGAIVQVEGEAPSADVLAGVCMHIVAHVPTPVGVDQSDVPAETLKSIHAAALAEAKESGKPEQIAAKIADGKVRKYLEENTLLDQKYVRDPSGKQSVREAIGGKAKVVKFVRFVVGGE